MCTDRRSRTRNYVGGGQAWRMVNRKHRRALCRSALLCGLVWLPVFGWPTPALAGAGAFVPPLPQPLGVIRSFAPPTQPWLPGNRGVDLVAAAGEPVLAATSGRVLYAGELAGRGVISIVSFAPGQLRTTYEPVDPVVRAGDHVAAGELIAHVAAATDDCGPPGSCLHWGALRGQAYVDPMRLLMSARVRLLPIWSGPPAWPEWSW
jgi:murein DD-endopeptidase MepM/ murein hydrolase activator NlpD